MSEYGQNFDRAELEEARLMALIGGQKPKQVVIHSKPVDGPTSPRNPTSPRVHHPTVVTTHQAPVNSIPVNRQPEQTEPTTYKPVQVSSDTRPSEAFNELDAETKATLEEERLVKAASRSVVKKVVATPTIERGPVVRVNWIDRDTKQVIIDERGPRSLEVNTNGNGALPTALIKGQWKVKSLFWDDGTPIEEAKLGFSLHGIEKGVSEVNVFAQ